MSIASKLKDLVIKWGGQPTKDDDSIEELIALLAELDAPGGGGITWFEAEYHGGSASDTGEGTAIVQTGYYTINATASQVLDIYDHGGLVGVKMIDTHTESDVEIIGRTNHIMGYVQEFYNGDIFIGMVIRSISSDPTFTMGAVGTDGYFSTNLEYLYSVLSEFGGGK